MSQPNQQNGGQEPWYQDDSGRQAKAFPFAQSAGSTEQQDIHAQPTGTPQQAPQHAQPAAQPAQAAQVPQPQQMPQQSYEPIPQGTRPYQGSVPPYPSGENTGQQAQQSPAQPPTTANPVPAQPAFGGILDPRTGEVHATPDLGSLPDTDALLVVVSGPDAGAQILLDTDVVTVGRSPNADIFLDDVTVSRKHAEFVRTPSGFTLRDTGSLNGTYVGRQLIDSIELQNGADVQIGKFRMIFQQRPRTA